MKPTLAFDVYGTLIDPFAIGAALSERFDDATDIATAWREKQLEYLFRRGLGRKYQPFSICTAQSLDFVLSSRGLSIDESAKAELLSKYLELPAYPSAKSTLATLSQSGFRLFAFSNGEPDHLDTLLARADLTEFLDGIISVHEVQSFKPDPSVYAHFLENTGALLGRTWLVSGNPFDVIGAMEVGWRAIWVRRDPTQLFDPWGLKPEATIESLDELPGVLP